MAMCVTMSDPTTGLPVTPSYCNETEIRQTFSEGSPEDIDGFYQVHTLAFLWLLIKQTQTHPTRDLINIKIICCQ